MLVRPAGLASGPLRVAVTALAGLWPLRVYASDRDPAEIGHAIWFMLIFSLFFLSTMALAIWLLVVRLRSGPPSSPEVVPQYPSLEKVWSKEARQDAAAPVADAREP